MKYIFPILLSFMLVGCQAWSEQYSMDYKMYLAGFADCVENDRVEVSFIDSGGEDVTLSAPSGHCSGIPTPKHSGEVYAPLIGAGILAGATVGTAWMNNEYNQNIAEINADRDMFISEQNRLSNQDMFGTFRGISSDQADITGQLITTNENLIGELLMPESEGEPEVEVSE